MIKYTSIINAWVSTEGSNGFMTNYVYYSLLVVDTNGSRQIVEGKESSLRTYLQYVRTPMDEIETLEATVKGLRQELNQLMNDKISMTVNSLFPIPNVSGMNEQDAEKLIREVGLTPAWTVRYPEGTPRTGKVTSFQRNQANFKKVDLTVYHALPDVVGKKSEEALAILKEAGFIVKLERIVNTTRPNSEVLATKRLDENLMNVNVQVSAVVPDITGMQEKEAVNLLRSLEYDVHVENHFDNDLPEGIV